MTEISNEISFVGLRRHWGQQRAHRTGSEMLQGGSHCHSRRYRSGEALSGACSTRLLGQQDWQAAHGAVQGDRQMRLGAGASHPGAQGYRHRVRPGPQEAASDGWYRGLLHLGQGLHLYTRQLRQGHVRRDRQDVRVSDARPVEGTGPG